MPQPPESDSTTAMETSIDIAMAKDDIAVPQSLCFPPEVWNMIGELIRTRSTLLTLISTCRAFNNLFTPFLRRKFALELTAIPPSQLRQKSLPPGLHHTRELEVLLEEMRGKEQVLKNYSRSLNHDYVSFVIRLLKETTNLQAFRWIDSTYDDTYRPTTMLRNRRLLRALKQSSTIKNVSILFASQYLDDPDDALRCSIPLDGFKNLTSLELYNFFGEPDPLIHDIANVLAECPDLKTLGLGFACDFDCYNSPEVLILSEEIHFLEKLCETYGSQPGIRPLVLETLRLGHGIFLFESVMQGDSETNKYLAKLVHLETLRNLYIYNSLVKQDLDDELIESMEVDWDQLEDCKSVRRLSVSRLEIDLVHWLKHGCKCLIEELIVTDHYGMYDDDLDNFKLLRLPQLSMLFIREMTVAERSGEDAWSDTESSAPDLPEAETISDAETISEAGSSSNREIALGPGNQSPAYSHSATESVSASEPASETQHTDEELSLPVMSILDRLYDNGTQLTKLGLCLDLETQWAQFSSHLAKLRKLTHLRLDGKSHRGGQYPTKASSLWPGVETSQDIAYHYGMLIHSKCPTLR
ncbi:hypothetical protein L207DRAFT_568185 [Hyaloscypha variabilis F]|uniref:Uncharacterized protein n=1 Tax=Hyaloscypha variabilis (strain UAMH 11265 / GT02V1 / F) TaxID=1149755 RepID=A0A2J6RJ60_HYAVF|nr:hypothetical protein L207DRAFT_568185 [Hyaloscypha variabilis F]